MQQTFSNFVPFGSAMPKTGITKFSAKLGDTRIRILSTECCFLARTHYLKGVGTFHCFGGSCCQAVANAAEGEANTQERAVLPIAVAIPSIHGGMSVEYQYLALPETKYTQLVSLNNNVGDITTYDILIQCTDENYQKYTFLPLVGQPSTIFTEAEMPNIQKFLTTYKDSIMKTLGKTLDENSFAAARAKSLQQAASGVGVNFTPNPTASQAFVQAPALPVQKPGVAPQIAVSPVPAPQPTVPKVTVEHSIPAVPPVPAEVLIGPGVPPTSSQEPATTPSVVEVVVEPTPKPQVVEPIAQAATTPVAEPVTQPDSGVTTDIDWSAFMNNND